MRTRPAAWQWTLVVGGSILGITAAIATLVGGSKLWLILLIVGVLAALIGNPMWSGLKGLRGQ